MLRTTVRFATPENAKIIEEQLMAFKKDDGTDRFKKIEDNTTLEIIGEHKVQGGFINEYVIFRFKKIAHDLWRMDYDDLVIDIPNGSNKRNAKAGWRAGFKSIGVQEDLL